MEGSKIQLILDLDGVLITTPSWLADAQHADGYSDFNGLAVRNLNYLLTQADFEIWLSSARRTQKTLAEFNQIFQHRQIQQSITGFLPLPPERVRRVEEIQQFLTGQNYLILDDDTSLHDLTKEQQQFWVKTDPLLGLNNDKLQVALQILNSYV